MHDNEKLTMLRNMCDETNDDILSTYLFIAKQIVLSKAYPLCAENKEVPECYTANQLRIAVYLINKRGAEGETSHTENGVSRTYASADVPYALLRDIIPMVEIIGG